MKNLIKLLTTVMFTVSWCFALNAQSLVKVSGVVTSADDGLPMIGVAVMDGVGNGVITSLDGDRGCPGNGTHVLKYRFP